MFPIIINSAFSHPRVPDEKIKAAAPAGGCVQPIFTMTVTAKEVASDWRIHNGRDGIDPIKIAMVRDTT